MNNSLYFPGSFSLFREFFDELRKQPVAVIGHMRPDGDCIGSQVALCRMINLRGGQAVAVNRDPVPTNLKPFIRDTPFFLAADFDPAGYLAVTVDCADALRPGEFIRKQFPEYFGSIDHHLSNEGYARYNFLETHTAATAEILAGLFLDQNLPLDPVIAQALYVGIATDTGQFRFPSTSLQVFKLCSALIAAGASPSQAASELYENESFNSLLLLQRFLASLHLEAGGKVCIGELTEKAYAETGTQREEAEGLVNYTRDIQGVVIGLFLEEHEGNLKGSLRAKSADYRVDQLAASFGGGGHACAAGFFQPSTTIREFYPKLLDTLEAHLVSVESESSANLCLKKKGCDTL